MSSSDKDDSLHFPAFDASPGEGYRKWRQHLYSYAATKTDESGSSLADTLQGVDMGGPLAGAPPIPPGAPGQKMGRLRDGRAKSAYALIYKHVSDGDLRTILFTNHFQDGHGAIQYLDTVYDTPITRSELREMDKLWTELSIAQDIGIQQDSVSRFAKLLQRVNSERPAANRYGLTEMCEKLLEAIADASRHFNEGAMREYDAAVGSRQFEYPAAHPLFPGQRNFGACVHYYDAQWKQAVKSKILTVTAPLRRTGSSSARVVVDRGMRVATASPLVTETRATSPTRTLQALAAHGVDVHDAITTTDFDAVGPADLAHAVNDSGEDDGFSLEQCCDAEGVPSVEIVCDNCRGVGHPRRLCPSPRRYRTFDYAITLLQSAKQRADARAQRDSRPQGGRRFPPRGQRAPFRPRPLRSGGQQQPRNFSPSAAGRFADEVAPPLDEPMPSDEARHLQPLQFDDEFFDGVLGQGGDDADAAAANAAHDAVRYTANVAQTRDHTKPLRSPISSTARRLVAVLVVLAHSLTLRAALIIGSVAVVANAIAAPIHHEHLGMLVGRAALSGIVACVDSGATVSCLSETLALSGRLDFQVTQHNPRRRLKVASDQVLDIVAMGRLRFIGVEGFRVINGKRAPAVGDAIFRNVAVVRGLSENTILLSVKSMKQFDGAQVYFNNDNSNRVDDCVRMPDGLYIPFVDGTHDLHLRSADSGAECRSMRDTPWDIGLRMHAALCHAGATRVQTSNITYNGRRLPPMPPPHACKGCRLGGGRAAPSSTGRKRDDARRPQREPLDHFGQLVSSDCCVGFPPSFPHGFTAMVNFCDGYSADRDRRFVTKANSSQVYAALADYCHVNRHRLRDGKIGCWKTDNGKEFRGECVTDAVDELLEHHDFTVPHNKNANAVAERDWGVIERGMRACLAYADDAPPCLWPWAAQQCSMVYHYLATTVHSPPRSAHEFLHPHREPVDMAWARVLFCDVTVALPERDVHGKLWHRAADGCHLGYDPKRRAHIVYCPRYRRLGTFTVTDWCGENHFTICKLITSDTPVEYHQVDDLPMAPATASLLPSHFRAGREPGAVAASASQQDELRQALAERADDIAHLAGAVESLIASESGGSQALGCEIVAPSHGAVFQAPALPTTVEEARRSPFWPMVKDALEDEIRGKFVDNQAWDVVPRTAGMHVIRSKWVLRWTLNEDGTIRNVKARLVACGYGQIEGREFTDVYARTLAAPSFRLFCSIVALENLETDHIDAYKAFTQSDVDCEIFVEMPFGFARTGHVLKLRKALEGIRQGAHLWMEHNRDVLIKLGFRQSLVEASLYVHSDLNIIIAVFADDIAAAYAADAATEYAAVKEQYVSHIRVRSAEITPLATFTGVNIVRDRERGTLTISQGPYIDQLAERYKGRFQQRNTPGPTSQAARREFDKQEAGREGDAQAVDRVAYLRLIGSLIWPASMTRPDIAYYVSFLASFNVCPLQSHMDAALNILGYLVRTRDVGITYGGQLKVPLGLERPPPGFVESGGLHTFHDSSWGTAAKPYGGFVVMRANGAILVSSRPLKIVPDSTAEAETAVASKAAKETTAIRAICEDLGRTVQGPTVLLGDNKASYDIIVKTGLTARTRYFERATLLIKRLYMLLAVVPYLVSTNHMVADVLTKCVDKPVFYRMRNYMLNCPQTEEASLVSRVATFVANALSS